jgi:hypothetical protein
MATEQELQIVAAGAQATASGLSEAEREEMLEKAFYEAQQAEPAGFFGLDFERWRKDAELSLYKGVCESGEALNRLLEAAKVGETDAIKYVTGLAIALVTPTAGWRPCSRPLLCRSCWHTSVKISVRPGRVASINWAGWQANELNQPSGSAQEWVCDAPGAVRRRTRRRLPGRHAP